MTLIDTHTHLYLPEFDSDRDKVIATAVQEGVTTMLLPNIDSNSLPLMLAITTRYKGICYPMIGLHPTSVKKNFEEELNNIFSSTPKNTFIAIGETGIDLYWDKTTLEEQKNSFRKHIEIALEHELPVVIHARDSFTEIEEVLNEYRGAPLKGVFHAFTGNREEMEKIVERGFMLGIGGIVTFRNSSLSETIATTKPEYLVLETDSPYLSPHPLRGKRNESSHLTHINRKVSEIYGITPDESAAITTNNARRLFSLPEGHK